MFVAKSCDLFVSINIDEANRVYEIDNAIAILGSQGFIPINHLNSESPQTESDRNRYSSAGFHSYAVWIGNSPNAIAISKFNLEWEWIWKTYCYYSPFIQFERLTTHILKYTDFSVK